MCWSLARWRLPKTANSEHMKANVAVDFTIVPADMEILKHAAPNDAYAQYFTGHSFLKPLTVPGESPVFLANVTFEPGCRNNWHIHHAKSGGSGMGKTAEILKVSCPGAKIDAGKRLSSRESAASVQKWVEGLHL